MFARRSPALALLGACFTLGACVTLGACFTDAGAPATGTDPAATSTAAASTAVEPEPTTAATTAEPASSTGEATTVAVATTTESTGTTTTTGADTDTDCALVPWYFDLDKDGYGGPQSIDGCGAPPPGYTLDSLDCDDSKSTINPDAEELCDGVDNDCDTGIDEYPAGSVTTCNGCRAVLAPDSTYYLCGSPLRDWDSARVHCKTLRGDLIVVDDDAEHGFIVDQSLNLKARWWIGLSDLVLEGQFVWVDDSPLDPQVAQWTKDEPNDNDAETPGAANCVAMLFDVFPSGGWRDQVCTNQRGTICEAHEF